MKRRFLALALALVMVVGLLPVLPVLTVSAVDEIALDMSAPPKNVASSDTEPVSFSTTSNTATLSGNMNRTSLNLAALSYTGTFPSTTNLDEHVTQTIQIDSMPVFKAPAFNGMSSASGYYNILSRNYQNAQATPLPNNKTAADCQDRIMYSIYRKDDDGNLGMQIYYMHPDSASRQTITVEDFAETIGVAFTLTTIWHADGKVTFVCDGEFLGTYDNVTFAIQRDGTYNNSFAIAYNGYDSSSATNTEDKAVNLTVSNVKIAHGHNPAADDGDCTTDIPCTVCGLATTVGNASHTFDHKVAADEYKKADGEYYYSCACGVSSAGFAQETTFTVMDLSPATSNTYTSTIPNYYDASDDADPVKFGVSAAGDVATLSGSMAAQSKNWSTLVYRDIFNSDTNQDVHLTQTINITTMPVFSNPDRNDTFSAQGYYNLLTRQYGSATAPLLSTETNSGCQDRILYSIYHKGDNNLGLKIYYAYIDDTGARKWTSKTVDNFAEEVGTPFTLTTVWDAENNVTFLCDGETLGTFTGVTFAYANKGEYRDCLVIGYNATGSTAASESENPVSLTVSNVQLTHAHEGGTATCQAVANCAICGDAYGELGGHTPEADDGDCTTAVLCADCDTVITEAKTHVSGEDDGNCVTPVLCSNSGCTHVFVEGHTLTHVDEVPATNDTTGTKEHWKCEKEGCEYIGAFYLDEAGTQKVAEGDLVISKNFEVSGDKSTVSENYVNSAIEDAGEGDVALEIETPEIELPAASLDALATSGKPLVITTSEGKVTLNPAAIAAIQTAAADSALSINVKKAGTAVLEDVQTNKLLESYTAIKDVITAEMLAGNTISTFGEGGTVTIEIPFVMDNGTVDTDYKLVYISDDAQTVEVINNARFEGGKVTATLTHFSDYAIVTSAVIPEPPIEGSGTITSNGGSAVATVTGTYVDGIASGDVFSVDVEWGNLAFNYMAANSWDAENHTYTGGGWEDVTGNVKVVNHSNIAVNVVVTKEDVLGEKNLGVDFVGASTDVLDAGTIENVENPDEFTVEFKPRGTLVEGDEDVTLATITVTITKYVPQN